jgi:predicted MFS family arabinose efflux permease
MKVKEGFLLFMLALVNFTHIMDFVIMAPLSPAMRKADALDISTKQFSILLASYTISAAIAGIAGSFFIDKFNRRKAMLFLYLGFCLSNFICAISNDYVVFMMGRVLAGGFGGVLGSLIFSVIGDVIPMERRGKATGIVMSAFAGASVLGIPAGLALAVAFFWQAPFILLTVLSLVVLIILIWKFPALEIHMQKKNPLTPFQNIISIFKDRNLLFSMAFVVVLMIAGLTVVPFLSDYLVNNTGVKQDNLMYIYIFGGIASAGVGPLVGILSDKFGKRKVYITAAILSVGPMWIMTHMTVVPLWQLLIFSTMFFIAFGARFVPAMAMVTSSVDMMRRGSFMSINSSVQQFGSSIAVGIAGIILSNGANGEIINFDLCGLVAITATLISIPLAYNVKQIS